jgi:hypothetical protein
VMKQEGGDIRINSNNTTQWLSLNALAGALIGLLVWLPTVFAVGCCVAIGIWFIQLIVVIIIGAIGAAADIQITSHPAFRRLRGGVSGLIIGLLFGGMLLWTLLYSFGTDTRFLTSWFLRFVVLIVVGISGYIAGVVGAYTQPNVKDPAVQLISGSITSITGSMAGGGFASLIIVVMVILSDFNNSDRLALAQAAMIAGFIAAIIGSLLSGLLGSIYALVGVGLGQIGNSIVGRAVGISFGTILGTFIIIGIILFIGSLGNGF